jgi:hypothetical protein
MTRPDPLASGTVGLCAGCRHARIVSTPRSTFWLCRRSFSDPAFAKYPRLPVLECPGYEPGEPRPAAGAEDEG